MVSAGGSSGVSWLRVWDSGIRVRSRRFALVLDWPKWVEHEPSDAPSCKA